MMGQKAVKKNNFTLEHVPLPPIEFLNDNPWNGVYPRSANLSVIGVCSCGDNHMKMCNSAAP